MARGQIAKDAVEKKIAAAFGTDYIGIYEKKLYVWASDGGERVQIAITLTCPKVPVETVNTGAFANELNFEEMGTAPVAPTTFVPAEVTDEEVENIQTLMARLGL